MISSGGIEPPPVSSTKSSPQEITFTIKIIKIMSEIKDEIRNGRIINKEVVTAAAEELAKKRNAKLTRK